MSETDLFNELLADISAFAAEREWEQFHTPKNLAMAVAGEAGELVAEFQWLTPDESKLEPTGDRFQAAREELADVLIYLMRLSQVLGIDLLAAAQDKLALNAQRYPTELSRGQSDRPAIA